MATPRNKELGSWDKLRREKYGAPMFHKRKLQPKKRVH